MRIAIHQGNYLPWMGYFRKMEMADIFVLFDDVQLPLGGHHYETRATIQTSQGLLDLNVPILDRGSRPLIKDALLASGPWKRKHIRSILQAYGDSPHYRRIAAIFAHDWKLLIDFNEALIREMAEMLNIRTRIVRSSNLDVPGQGTDKILGIVKSLGGDTYISGTGIGSRRYVNEPEFARHGIQILWHTYQGPNLSAIDAILHARSSVGLNCFPATLPA